MRRLVLFALLLVFGATTGLWAQPALRYGVHALGVKIGELVVTSDLKAGHYDAEARFRATGLAGAFRRVAIHMKTQGVGHWPDLIPTRYQEKIQTGERQSSAQIIYRNGHPQVTGGRLGNEDSVRVDLAAQKGTIDPMTALFLALAAQPPDKVCALRREIFDGARRSRLVLGPPRQSQTGLSCTGQLIRVAGYPKAQIARDPRFDLSLTYQRGPQGAYHMTRAQAQSIYGPLVLIRR